VLLGWGWASARTQNASPWQGIGSLVGPSSAEQTAEVRATFHCNSIAWEVAMRKVLGRFTAGCALLVGVLGGAGLTLLPAATSSAGAAITIVVNDANDASPTPANCTMPTEGDCTLRAAVLAANAAADDAVITLPDAADVPNNPNSSHIYGLENGQGEIDFDDSGHTVTVNGAGAASSIVQMQNEGPITNRVFNVLAGTTADISGVSVEDGNVSADIGGGILNNGTLNLTSSTVSGNNAQTGAGVYLETGNSTLTNDSIDGNTAASAGGGVYIEGGVNTIAGGEINTNTAAGAGGGLYVEDDHTGDAFTATGVTIDSNTSTSSGGGVYLQNNGSTVTTATLTNDSIDDNTAGTDAGGLYVENDGTGNTVTISGGEVDNNTATTSDAGGIYLQNDGLNTSVSMTGVDVSSNSSGTDAGGMYIQNDGSPSSVTIDNGEIDSNSAQGSTDGFGGGVYVQNDGDPSTLSITGTDLSSNSGYEGGGVYVQAGQNTFGQDTISNNDATEAGGGMAFDTTQEGATSVVSSTISDNNVGSLLGNSGLLGDGGGIVSESCNSLALTNDTIAGNDSAFGGGYFGTACAENPSVSTAFLFDTVSGNVARDTTTGSGNLQTDDDSTLTLGETIVAAGTGGPSPNCSFTGPGSVTSQGFNLFDSGCGTAAATDLVGVDPQLGALANNGGPTLTELPASTSPAVGAVPSATCSATGVATDQRGEARGGGANGSCTIGAVEVAQESNGFNPNGYRLVGSDGGIFDFGLLFNGSLANLKLNAPIVGLANSPGPSGYLMVGSDGGVFAQGGANFYGSLGGTAVASPISAIAAPPTETGYWLAAQNGKTYPFGSVPALPTAPVPPGGHIVGMASTTDGQGAWLTDQFGDVFAEGDAQYEGGLGGVHLNAPIVGLAAAASGQGYVLVAADGGVFNYGTQGFFGSVPGSLAKGQHLIAPIVGIAVTHSGNGYWEVGADGGVFNYGDAPFLGSTYTYVPGDKLNAPIVGIQHLGEAA
jgi:hypothetical protein